MRTRLRADFRFQPLLQNHVLRCHAHRAAAGMAVVADAGRRAELVVVGDGRDMLALVDVGLLIAAQRKQHALTDGHRIGAQCQRLGDIGAGANAAGHDQLHLVFHVQVFERIDGLTHRGQRRNAHVLDEGPLRGGRAALHAVDDDDVRAGMHGQLHVVEHARGAHLHVDGLFPVRDLAQFLDLDGQVVRPGPVRMTARRALVDAFRAACASSRRAG